MEFVNAEDIIDAPKETPIAKNEIVSADSGFLTETAKAIPRAAGTALEGVGTATQYLTGQKYGGGLRRLGEEIKQEYQITPGFRERNPTISEYSAIAEDMPKVLAPAIVGGLVGGPVGAGVSIVGTAALFGGEQGQRSYESAKAQGMDDGDALSASVAPAITSAAFAAAMPKGGQILRSVAKKAIPALAAKAAPGVVGATSYGVKQAGRDIGLSVLADTPIMQAQGAAVAQAEKMTGARPDADPMKEVLLNPKAWLTAGVTGGMFGGLHAIQAKAANARVRAYLEDPQINETQRLQAVNHVAETIARDGDPAGAVAFGAQAADMVRRGEAVPLDNSLLTFKVEAPKSPEEAKSEVLRGLAESAQTGEAPLDAMAREAAAKGEAQADESVAAAPGVKMFITEAETQRLRDLGIAEETINRMKPDEATTLLKDAEDLSILRQEELLRAKPEATPEEISATREAARQEVRNAFEERIRAEEIQRQRTGTDGGVQGEGVDRNVAPGEQGQGAQASTGDSLRAAAEEVTPEARLQAKIAAERQKIDDFKVLQSQLGDQYPDARVTPSKTAVPQDLQNIANFFGKRIHFYDVAGKGPGGAYVGGDAIFLKAKAKQPHILIFGHELTHAVKDQNRAAYDELMGVVRADLKNFSKLKEVGYKPEEMPDEALAEFVGERMTNQAFWTKLHQADATLFERVANTALQILKGIKNVLTGEQWVSDIEKAENAVIKALRRYKMEPKAEGPEVVKQSRFSRIDEAGATEAQKSAAKRAWERLGTKSPFFKKWFGDSKATWSGEAGGVPQVWFRGSNRDSNILETGTTGYAANGLKRPLFLSQDSEFANEFAPVSKIDPMTGQEKVRGGNVSQFYVKAENPWDFRKPEDRAAVVEYLKKKYPHTAEVVLDDGGARLAAGDWALIESPEVQRYIQKNHDSFFVNERINTPEGFNMQTNLAVLDSSQLKSKFNTGHFGQAPLEASDVKDMVLAPGVGVGTPAEQVRIANQRQAEGDVRFSKFEEEKPFYSQVRNLLDSARQTKWGSGKELLAWMKGKVSQDEIKMLGLDEFEGKKNVTKAEIMEAVQANSMDFKDVVLGESAHDVEAWWNDEGGANEEIPFSELTRVEQQEAVRRYQEEVGDFAEDAPHFAQYTEPGAKEGSYREMFVTVPDTRAAELQSNYERGKLLAADHAEWANLKNKLWSDGHSQYSEIQNPIVRIRFNTRTVPLMAGENNSFGKKFLNLLRSVPNSKSILHTVQRGVEAARQHKQIGDKIISFIPVDVVNSLRAQKLTPKDVLNNDSMGEALASMPVEVRLKVGRGIATATEKTEAFLRAKVLGSLAAGRDTEILPTIRTSDLDPRYVSRLITSKDNTLSGQNLQPENIGAGAATSALGFVGARRNEDGSTDFTGLLDAHAKMISGKTNNVKGSNERKILFIEEMQPPTKDQISKMPEYLRDRAYAIGVKRILAYARENGFDGVSWTPAETQHKRWGSERVDWVAEPEKAATKWGVDTKRSEGASAYSQPVWFDSEAAARAKLDVWTAAGFKTAHIIDNSIPARFRVSMKEQEGGNAGGIDIETTARERGQLLEERGTVVTSKEELLALVKRNVREGNAETITDKVWKQMQENSEGTYRPRLEFMKSIYGEEKGPQNLGTLFKKYGGEGVSTTPLTTTAESKFQIISPDGTILSDPAGPIYYNSRQAAQAKVKKLGQGFAVIPAPTSEVSAPFIPISEKTPSSYAMFSRFDDLARRATDEVTHLTGTKIAARVLRDAGGVVWRAIAPIDRVIRMAQSSTAYAPISKELDTYLQLKRQYQAAGTDKQNEAKYFIDDFRKAFKDEKQHDAFNNLTHRATLYEMYGDPEKNNQWTEAEWKSSGNEAKFGKTLDEAKAELRSYWEAMTPEQQQLQQRMIENMRVLAENLRQAQLEPIRAALGDDAFQEAELLSGRLGSMTDEEISQTRNAVGPAVFGAAEQMQQINESRSMLRGDYAPLMRFGDHFVRVYKWENGELGEEVEAKAFERKQDMIDFVNQVNRSADRRATQDLNTKFDRATVNIPESFIAEIRKGLEARGIDGRTIENMVQDMMSARLAMMPRTELAGSKLRRKGMEGYDNDALRAYAQYAQAASEAAAKLMYGSKIEQNFTQMKNNIKAYQDPNVEWSPDNVERMSRLRDMLYENHQASQKEKINLLTKIFGKSSAFWYLASPSVTLVQWAQPFMMTVPKMAAKFGMPKALAAYSAAARDFLAGKFADEKIEEFDRKNSRIGSQVFALIERYREGTPAEKAQLNQQMKDLYDSFAGEPEKQRLLILKVLSHQGMLDLSASHNLHDFVTGETALGKNIDKIMEKGMFFMQKAETGSRRAAAISAFETMMKDAKDGGDFMKANDYAANIIEDTLGDFSAKNRSAILRGNAGRILGQFQYFRLHALSKTMQLFKDSFDQRYQEAVKTKDPVKIAEAKKLRHEARKELSYVMGMSLAFAGAGGTPLAVLLSNTATNVMWEAFKLVFGDKDDPWEPKKYFEEALKDAVGEDVGNVALKGLPAIFGLDISKRVGMGGFGEIVQGDPPAGMSPTQKSAWYASRLFGPTWGMVTDGMKVFDALEEGDTATAFSAGMPKMVKDVTKAFTLATEGAQSGGKTTVKPEDVSPWSVALQMLGVNPIEVSLANEERRELRNLSTQVATRRRVLTNAYAKAVVSGGDVAEPLAALNAWGSKHPALKITSQELVGALKRERDARAGKLTKKEMILKEGGA